MGSRISHFLIERGCDVVICSRTLENINIPPKLANVISIDWSSDVSLFDACKKVDIVVHAAGINALECSKDPVRALEYNGLYTSRLVDAAICNKVKKFFYLSTAHVYADILKGNITENSCALNLHPYSTSHLAGENSLLYAISKNKIFGSVIRLSNGYGAPIYVNSNCWGLFVNDLCRQSMVDRKLVINTTGEQLKDFVPINFICSVFLKLINLNNLDLPNIVNLGSGITLSLLDMAKFIQSRCAAKYNYSPEIILGNHYAPVSSFNYKSMRLFELGCTFKPDYAIFELDNLLDFCKHHLVKM